MAKLEEVVSALDEHKAYLESIDAAVEVLHDKVKSLEEQVQIFTDQGITPAAADMLIAKIADIKSAADKIVSDD